MEPKMTATLTVHTRGSGDPALLVTPHDGDPFNIPLTEDADVIARLVRELAGLVVARARREVDAVAQAVKEVGR